MVIYYFYLNFQYNFFLENSIACLLLKNDENKNLLHYCAIYGARDCLLYLIKFKIIKTNEKDDSGEVPLSYLIKNQSENTKRNREMFLWLCNFTEVLVTNSEGVPLIDLFNSWQNHIYKKYVVSSKVRNYVLETESN